MCGNGVVGASRGEDLSRKADVKKNFVMSPPPIEKEGLRFILIHFLSSYFEGQKNDLWPSMQQKYIVNSLQLNNC